MGLHRRCIFMFLASILLLHTGCSTPDISGTISKDAADRQLAEEIDPSCSYFYFLWARYTELYLQFDEALAAYRKALICDPGNPFIQRKIPVILLRMERDDEAVTWLKKHLVHTPDDTAMRELLAKAYLRQNNFDQAILEYQYLIQQLPGNPIPRYLLAELFFSRKEYERAQHILLPVLTMDNGAPRGHLLLARIFKRQHNPTKAIYHLQQVLLEQWTADIVLEIGELYLENKEYVKAMEAYQEVLDRDEYSQEARIGLFHVYQLLDQEDKAVNVLEGLRQISDQPWRIDLILARLYIKQRKYAAASSLLEEVVAIESMPEARYLLGQLYVQREQYDDALHHLQQIDSQGEYFTDALFLKIHIYQQQGRINEAVSLVKGMVDREDIRSAELYAVLAALYEIMDDQKGVAAAYANGIAAFPESAMLLYEYGLFQENSGDRKAALQAMKQVIIINPENAAALNFIGYTWADEGRNLDQALEYIQKAVQLKPDNGYIQDSLGWVYFRMGKLALSIEALKKAVELSPDDPAIFDHLGDAYAQNGQYGQAIVAYQRAWELFVDNPLQRDNVMEKIIRSKKYRDNH